MADSDGDSSSELEPRSPTQQDLTALCRELNRVGASYAVIGGFAVILAGFPRFTGDIDLLIETSPENEQRVFKALEILPDRAVNELRVGEVAEYAVVRVADEIIVDLMRSAGGIGFAEAAKDLVFVELDGVQIPCASPRLLWRMKRPTNREKDAPDLYFLRHWFADRGEEPPP
jgi:predicted nucleotidyltransferase